MSQQRNEHHDLILLQSTVLGSMAVEYTIHFNSVNTSKVVEATADAEEGPIVERKCPKCGNDRMSYATLQLRSADEGQTVFFTCTKCKCVLQAPYLLFAYF